MLEAVFTGFVLRDKDAQRIVFREIKDSMVLKAVLPRRRGYIKTMFAAMFLCFTNFMNRLLICFDMARSAVPFQGELPSGCSHLPVRGGYG